MIMGLEYQWVTDPGRVDFGQAMETYIDELIERLVAQPGTVRATRPVVSAREPTH